MLVLTRKVGEALILDGGIEVIVKDIQGKHAKPGINAPKEVKIYHEEVIDRLPDYMAPPYG